MRNGTVKWFNSQKGYGFITDMEGNDIFVHHTGISMDGFRALVEGQSVEFDIEINQEKNKEQAINVTTIIK